MIKLNAFMISFTKGNPTADSIWQPVKSVLPSITRCVPLLGTLIFVLLLLPFGPCLFNLLVKVVSFGYSSSHTKMMVLQGFQPKPSTETTLEGGLDPLDQQEEIFSSRLGRVNVQSQPERVTEVWPPVPQQPIGLWAQKSLREDLWGRTCNLKIDNSLQGAAWGASLVTK